jgi:hypothetical protein
VVQEGFMAASVCHHEPTDISVNPQFRRQRRQVDPTINAMSSASFPDATLGLDERRKMPAWNVR